MAPVFNLKVSTSIAFLEQNPDVFADGKPAWIDDGNFNRLVEIQRCFNQGHPDLLLSTSNGNNDLVKWCFEHGQSIEHLPHQDFIQQFFDNAFRIHEQDLRAHCRSLAIRPVPEIATLRQVCIAAGAGDVDLFEEYFNRAIEVQNDPDGPEAHAVAATAAEFASSVGNANVVRRAIAFGALEAEGYEGFIITRLIKKGQTELAEEIINNHGLQFSSRQLGFFLQLCINFNHQDMAERLLTRPGVEWGYDDLKDAYFTAKAVGNARFIQELDAHPVMPWNSPDY